MKILNFFLFIFLLFGLSKLVYSVECTDNLPSSAAELGSYISKCQEKISSLKNEQQTLKAAILTLDSKIRLTLAQITLTTKEISQLEKDIETLSLVVSDLNSQLDKLTSVYVSRVVESYKRRDPSPLVLLASSDNLTSFLSKKKYLTIIKARDRLILGEMTSAKQNYDAQKEAKIVKQQQIKELKDKLLVQQQNLSGQQNNKRNLLLATQNDEKKYEQLRSDAVAQLAAINRFVANQGGASILKDTTKNDGTWGKYYNQRDESWGNQALGSSNTSVADAGCLITSMAMIMSHYGKNVSPAIIASNQNLFTSYYPFADFLLGDLIINGTNTSRVRIAYSKSTALETLNRELSINAGKPVIVGIIQYGSNKPEHFLVIKSKEGDDYIINDPFPEKGMNTKFTSRYSLSTIATVDRVVVN